MTRKMQITFLSITMVATLAIASTANAQFSFGGAGISFGGSKKSTSGLIGRTVQSAVQSSNRNSVRPFTDLRRSDLQNFSQQGHTSSLLRKATAMASPIILGRSHGADRGYRHVDPKHCSTPAPVIEPVPVYPSPEPVVTQPPAGGSETDLALELTYEAQAAFAEQNYPLATETMDRVLKITPDSASAYQFRALTHFAQSNYDEAAADVYETLLRGTLWNWKTVYPLYGNQYTYTNQYRLLSRAANEDQGSMSKHFLLAYHHLMLGHLEHGETELQKVLTIQPNEPVTQQLLVVVRNLKSQDKVAMQ